MRRLEAALLSVLLATAAYPAAAAASPVRVQRVVPPDVAARRARAGLPSAAVMRPEEARAQQLRVQRWRSFPDVVTRPGFDGSVRAARRVGWRAPAAPLKAQHAALVADTTLPYTPPDTLRIAFIRIDFLADRGGDASSGSGRFDLTPYDSTTPPIDPPPHNRRFFLNHLDALSRFYEAESYGRTKIVGDVWPRQDTLAYHLSDMADLGPWAFSRDIYRTAVDMFQAMVLAADSQSTVLGDRLPWDQYDRFMFIHAGSDLQSDVRQDSKEDIPSFTIGVVDTDEVVLPGVTRPIGRASIIPERIDQDGYYGALNGVIAHENGHNCFGFEDLYDFETGLPVVGLWSLMDSGNLAGARVLLKDGTEIFATGMLPPSVDPWQRYFTTDTLAFPEVLYGDTLQALQNSERHPDMRRVTLSSDEYLLLENRWQSPADTLVEFEQDSVSHVVLAPKTEDKYEYDALLPGGGILVWHIDTSVIPFETSLRINPDYGFNTNPERLAISVIEADGLQDLGDPGSPYLLGAPFDPWFLSNNAVLGDSTRPNLIPHIRTRPHRRLEFADDPDPTMHFRARRSWALGAWPVSADFPPGGPQLLAIDADGDRNLDVCWSGGADSLLAPDGSHLANPDSAALFAIRPDGTGIDDSTAAFAHFVRRPLPPLAAIGMGKSLPGQPAVGPSLFAFTVPDPGARSGSVWLTDHHGTPEPGWPLAIQATTPVVIVGVYPNIELFQGTADGGVCGFDRFGDLRHLFHVAAASQAGTVGRLAIDVRGDTLRVAGATADGWIGVKQLMLGVPDVGGDATASVHVFGGTWDPDFLWIGFDGPARPPSLIVHHANRLWGFDATGAALPGWNHVNGDTLVAGLGAGDPDGDGNPEVLTQSVHSELTFWNRDGYPSPGWPKRGTKENLRTWSPPLALDVDGDHRSEVVGMNASGVIAALRGDGRQPDGWPLATGAGATGAPVAADLDRDGQMDVVAPDRFGILYAYTTPVGIADPTATAWTMLGGDPGRTSALPTVSTPTPPGPSSGPLVAGTLKAFPNPARRHPVHFAYTLTEPADVEFRIFDASGHQVSSFSRRGGLTENVEVWDPENLPSGLYVARVRFRGTTSERTEVLPVALLR